jgi:hypothetical protein
LLRFESSGMAISISRQVLSFSVSCRHRKRFTNTVRSVITGTSQIIVVPLTFTLSLHNKLLLYKQILKPVWTYGIQIWGCTKQSNIDIKRFQNEVLRHTVHAPWYIRNNDLYRDLQVDVVSSEIQRFAQNTKEDSTIMRTMRPYSSWTTRA